MSKLTVAVRKKIKTSSFAIPNQRKYPIHDISHARNALSRVSQYGTPAEKVMVHNAVYNKYPQLKK